MQRTGATSRPASCSPDDGCSAGPRIGRYGRRLVPLRFASLPPRAIVALMSLNVITPSTDLALGLATGLLAVDVLAWRAVAGMFDRERLVTSRPT